MGHIPEDDNYDEFMNASAEEWSKTEKPAPKQKEQHEATDRWGSTIPEESPVSGRNRWGSEPIEPTLDQEDKEKIKKVFSKWWIVAIIVVAVLCSCACVVLAALEIFQVINIF